MTIKINPATIRNAAIGLERSVAPDLQSLAGRLEHAYPVLVPAFGVALLPVEAYYNQVALYHVENLKAGQAAVEAMVRGLRLTADNYQTAEEVNVTNLLGTPSKDSDVSYGDGFRHSAWNDQSAETYYAANAGAEATSVVEVIAMSAGVVLAAACAAVSWPFGIVVAGATCLVANVVSMLDVAADLDVFASDFADPTISRYNDYTTGPSGATIGWEDSSVADFIRSAHELGGELGQSQECIKAWAGFLRAVAAALTGLWVAFLAFLPAFFAAVAATAATGFGVPAAEAMGALAAAGWSGVFAMVLAAIGAMVAIVGTVLGAVSGIQTMDTQGDNVPDLKQIRLEWTTNPND
jgi:hypothetical protein